MINLYKPEGSWIITQENREYLASRQTLERAVEDGRILEAVPFLCDRNMTLHFSFGNMHAVMPREEVEDLPAEEIKDIAVLTRVGKPICFKVIGFECDDDGGERAVLSRKAAQRECQLSYIDGLIPGDILPARVTHLEPFGAFLDIGCGIASLMSIDAISVSRIAHPKERLSPGDRIFTVVRSIDERRRVCASMRELLGTWEENAAQFAVGQTVAGVIRSMESYGAFVELAPNLAGLAELRDDIAVGQSAAVYIKNILPDRMKIKLVIIDTHDRVDAPPPLRYFVDTVHTAHIDRWRYSPAGAPKTIESVFTE